MKIFIRLAAIVAVFLTLGAIQAAAADSDGWISSDGRIISTAQLVGDAARGASHGFRGRAAEGAAKDSRSTFRASVDTPEEYAALLRRRPKTATGSAEAVLGSDLRSRFHADTYPHTAIGLLTFDQGAFAGFCTGFLISHNVVATTGHCVHEGFGGNFSTNVVFTPGKDGASNPFGSCNGINLFTHVNWANFGLETFDYGAVVLDCTVGDLAGWFGFWWQIATLTGQHALIVGYPDDVGGGTEQWGSFGRIQTTQARQIFYFNDTFDGTSGSPVYQPDRVGSFCQVTCAMGIHAYANGHGSGPHLTQNHGTRINRAVFLNLLATILLFP